MLLFGGEWSTFYSQIKRRKSSKCVALNKGSNSTPSGTLRVLGVNENKTNLELKRSVEITRKPKEGYELGEFVTRRSY